MKNKKGESYTSCLGLIATIGFIVALCSFFAVPRIKAVWNRLVLVNDSTLVNAGTVQIVYDKQEKVNCYIYDSNNNGGIFCMKALK